MKKEIKEKCICPFCEEELKLGCFEPIFCEHCKIVLIKCQNCGQLFNEKLEKCPTCGFYEKKYIKRMN
jgi:ribosomal protein L37E